MNFEILSASDVADAGKWDLLIESMPSDRRDIHFTSAYGRVQEKLGGKAILVVLQTGDGFVVQPFIIKQTPFDDRYSDLCSPYGYGGPISMSWSNDPPDHREAFTKHLTDWCADTNVVSEFCYLHPLMYEHQRMLINPFLANTIPIKNIVIINLKQRDQVMSRTIRRGRDRAINNGAQCIDLIDQPIARQRFYNLYRKSMERKQAADRWQFPNEYLGAHCDELGAKLYHATDNDGGARMLMVIGKAGTAYAHFLGSNGLSLHKGLDAMIYCEVATMLRADGYERFHLGGGVTNSPLDSVLAFKSGFTKPAHKLFSYRRIIDKPIYFSLMERKLEDEKAKHGRYSTSSFFPVYRREFIRGDIA